jgi:xylulokinase
LKLLYESKVDFDTDLPHYGTDKGVLTNAAEGETYSPVAMWLEAIDLTFQRLKEHGLDFESISGVSGAGMQHGTVFWTKDAELILDRLDPNNTLVEQLTSDPGSNHRNCFSHAFSPNWQDASTQTQCEQFDNVLGSPELLATVTGSKAHHRFSGPQIMRFRENHPEKYSNTARISLVSSFTASILLGKIAPIDVSDVGGMNLFDIKRAAWIDDLLSLAAGGKQAAEDLREKLGDISTDGGASYGNISRFFVHRYNFSPSCQILPFTGDNPATILSLPLKENEAIVSLGTSTTFLMSTPYYKPDPSYHFMSHPTTPGLYMFMLCYKNGGLAREQIRDAVNGDTSNDWTAFNNLALSSPPLGQSDSQKQMRLGLFFPRPEIVPAVSSGTWRAQYTTDTGELQLLSDNELQLPSWNIPADDIRVILESQFLSMRLRSQPLVSAPESSPTHLPPQPSRIYLVGGGSLNPAIADVCGSVLGGAEGVYKLDIGGNACALGAAYKAVWGCERQGGESFESFIGKRWKEESFVSRIDEGYRKGIWEQYGEALKGFDKLERQIVALEKEKAHLHH